MALTPMVAPTAMSMPPAARTIVMPMAMTRNSTLVRAIVARLAGRRKTGEASVKTRPAARQAAKQQELTRRLTEGRSRLAQKSNLSTFSLVNTAGGPSSSTLVLAS